MSSKLDYAATGRNKDAILEVLKDVLPETGTVLEIASGSGQHIAHFARILPNLTWQPSDMETEHRLSIAEWAAGLSNVREVIDVDVCREDWSLWTDVDAIFCANMIHIAPWEVAIGLMAGAGRYLPAGAPLILYGPFIRSDAKTAPSNISFDLSLRSRNPAWGIRDLADVAALANDNGLEQEKLVEMPANNLTVIFRKT